MLVFDFFQGTALMGCAAYQKSQQNACMCVETLGEEEEEHHLAAKVDPEIEDGNPLGNLFQFMKPVDPEDVRPVYSDDTDTKVVGDDNEQTEASGSASETNEGSGNTDDEGPMEEIASYGVPDPDPEPAPTPEPTPEPEYDGPLNFADDVEGDRDFEEDEDGDGMVPDDEDEKDDDEAPERAEL
jgi:hypothetical protein